MIRQNKISSIRYFFDAKPPSIDSSETFYEPEREQSQFNLANFVVRNRLKALTIRSCSLSNKRPIADNLSINQNLIRRNFSRQFCFKTKCKDSFQIHRDCNQKTRFIETKPCVNYSTLKNKKYSFLSELFTKKITALSENILHLLHRKWKTC